MPKRGKFDVENFFRKHWGREIDLWGAQGGYISRLQLYAAQRQAEKYVDHFFATPEIRDAMKKLNEHVHKGELHPYVAKLALGELYDIVDDRIHEKMVDETTLRPRKRVARRFHALFQGASGENPSGLHEIVGRGLFQDLSVDTRTIERAWDGKNIRGEGGPGPSKDWKRFEGLKPDNHLQLTIQNGKVMTRIIEPN